MVQARHLVRELGTTIKQRVVDGVSFDVMPGDFVALTGASGSGKSTLLYLLGILDRPTSGTLRIAGTDVSSLDDDARARFRGQMLGYVFQHHFLLPELTVLENVTLPMLRARLITEGEAKRRGREALEGLGLQDLLHRKPSELSGGQQQRVAIARAIAGRPRLLLADEPTGALDSSTGETVMEIFDWLTRRLGITLVMVTHDRGFAARARRELVVRDGKLVDVIVRTASNGYRLPGMALAR